MPQYDTVTKYSRFIVYRNKMHEPRLFVGIGPVGICISRNLMPSFHWYGWNTKYRTG